MGNLSSGAPSPKVSVPVILCPSLYSLSVLVLSMFVFKVICPLSYFSVCPRALGVRLQAFMSVPPLLCLSLRWGVRPRALLLSTFTLR